MAASRGRTRNVGKSENKVEPKNTVGHKRGLQPGREEWK